MLSRDNKKIKFDYMLIADDDLDDQELIRDALNENFITDEQIHLANNGEELIEALSSAKQLPNIIILDLNMPKKNGREALEFIKTNEKFQHIPVIMFSTSDAINDIKDCYRLGSNTYITKPSGYSDLVETMSDITRYWGIRAQIIRE